MKIWSNLSLKQKTTIGSLMVIILLTTIGIISSYGIESIEKDYEHAISKEYKESITILQLQLATARQQYSIIKSITFGTKANNEEYQFAGEDIKNKLAKLEQLSSSDNKDIELINSRFAHFRTRKKEIV